MARLSWIVLTLLLAAACSDLVAGEIHRAKPSPKSKVYRENKPGSVDENALPSSQSGGLGKTDEEINTRREVWLYAILSSVLVGLSGIFPLLVIPIEAGPSLQKGAGAARLKLLLSFAVGGLLGDVFLHLLPEAWGHVQCDVSSGEHDHTEEMKIGLWVLAGILVFLIIEKIFSNEEEKEESEEADEQIAENIQTSIVNHHNGKTDTVNGHLRQRSDSNKTERDSNKANGHLDRRKEGAAGQAAKQPHIKISGYLNLLANVIDNFTHGLAVGGSYLVSTKVGLLTTFAILIHEIPHEVGDFAILLKAGFDRWRAAKAQLFTAAGGLVGALAALLADSAESVGNSTAWILPFTSGGFLNIALVTVVPELLKEDNPRESIKQIFCIILGISCMATVTLICG